jgi:hypothetical protein
MQRPEFSHKYMSIMIRGGAEELAPILLERTVKQPKFSEFNVASDIKENREASNPT